MFCKLNEDGLKHYPEMVMKYLKIIADWNDTVVAKYNNKAYYINKNQITYVYELSKSDGRNCERPARKTKSRFSNFIKKTKLNILRHRLCFRMER